MTAVERGFNSGDRKLWGNELWKPLLIPPDCYRYRALIGVGGIGSGQFFAVHGDRTISREESRGGRFLDRRDYCKLHIIAHYVATLLGPDFATIPVGKVGDDDIGRRLLQEMQHAGLDVRRVTISPGDQTLFSFCIVYPDGSGGNLTTDDSASAHVNPALVLGAEEDFRIYHGNGIALAAPEVSMEARAELIRLGSAHGFLRVASFTSGEVSEMMRRGLVRDLDMLALNLDEAAAIVDVSTESVPADEVVRQAVQRLSTENPKLQLSITAGRDGSWSWNGDSLNHVPSISVPVQGTAGAGDAHLAGLIVGLVAGLSLAQAQQFAALVSALSVTSPHTIHPGMDRETLGTLARQSQVPLDYTVRAMLGSDNPIRTTAVQLEDRVL